MLILQLPLGRLHIAVAISDLAIGDIEAVHHAVAAEPVMVLGVTRLELRIRTDPEQRPAQARRDLAGDLQVEIILGPDRREVAREVGIDAHIAVHGESSGWFL